MSKWLAALKKHENTESQNCQNRQNPAEEGSVSFVSAVQEEISNFSDPLNKSDQEVLAVLSVPVLRECEKNIGIAQAGVETIARGSTETLAAETPKPSPCGIAAERIQIWLDGIGALPKTLSPFGEKLRSLTEDFWRGPWAFEAIRIGRTDVELFALGGGLIPEMARRGVSNVVWGEFIKTPRFIVGGLARVWWLDLQFKRGE